MNDGFRYELNKISNGWVVQIVHEDSADWTDTFATTLGEAFEIIRKHAKELKPGQENRMDQYSWARE